MASDCTSIWSMAADVASTLIALCALGFTAWQVQVSRRHNKLSMKPHLTTWYHSDSGVGTVRFQYDLLNNGTGPALVRSFLVFVDGQQMTGEGVEPLKKALKVLFPNYTYKTAASFLGDKYMMAAKERVQLLNVEFVGPTFPNDAEVDHALNRARLIIKYESIYGDSQTLDTDERKATSN